jgi:membrane protein YdbS with pleckstrin-like domain
MTDIVPILVFFTAFNFRLPQAQRARWQGTVAGMVAVLAVISAMIHAQGALRYRTWEWNYVPNEIDRNTQRAWQWTDPQFAR